MAVVVRLARISSLLSPPHPTNEDATTIMTATTPALPHLYFSSFSGDAAAVPSSSSPSLQTLPPELLHACLVQYSDWGELAKLACVQRGWKNIVDDAAGYGGRDAMWELSMCLLHGDDSRRRRRQQQQSEDDTRQTADDNDYNNSTVAISRNNRGLEKNEILAVRYLARLCGVEQEVAIGQSNGRPTRSVLPSDEAEQDTIVIADEAALLELASCHLTGSGVSQPSPILAIQYLLKAYQTTKSVESAYKLALIYESSANSNGLIDIDIVAAYEWYKAAAINGHVTSMAELALCYELGCGVERNDEEALDWYIRAANAGHTGAHYSVGEHFEEARGVNEDYEEACLWYYRAAVLGEEDGVGGLQRLVEVARRVVPRVRVYRELGCYLY
jgi:TPR repeat protein